MADSFIGDALMGLGQGLTGQPFLTNFEKLKQDASQWRDSMAQKAIENQQAQQKLNIDQTSANNTSGMMAAVFHMTPQEFATAMNPNAPQAPSLVPSPQGMLPTAPQAPQPPPGAMMSMQGGGYGDASGNPLPMAPTMPQANPTVDASSKIQKIMDGAGLMPSFENGKFSLKPAYGALPQDQVQSMAQQLVDGKQVPSQMTGFRGAGRSAILQAAQAIDSNYNPATADMNYAAQKMGVSNFTKNFANLQSFSGDFEKNADYLLQLSKQLPRSSFPIINHALITGAQEITGDPLATKFVHAFQTVSNAQARLQNPSLSGQALSDAARGESRDLANKFMSPEQVDALLNPKDGSMRIEARNRISAAQETLDALKGTKSAPVSPLANDSFIANAKAHGYTNDQIQAYLKAKNGK